MVQENLEELELQQKQCCLHDFRPTMQMVLVHSNLLHKMQDLVQTIMNIQTKIMIWLDSYEQGN